MSRKAITSCAVLAFVAFALCNLSGCQRSEYRGLIYLAEHFRKNGLDGRYRKLKAESIGAEEAASYASPKFRVEFAKFADPKDAERRAKKGFRGFKCYANGHFVMLVRRREPGVKLVKVFKSF